MDRPADEEVGIKGIGVSRFARGGKTMKGDVTNTTGQSFRLAIFIGASILVLASSVYGQSGSGTRAVPCMVNYLRLRITTGQDDLRGWDGFSTSKDNLDVTVYFGENGSQLAADVNNNQEWKNKSVHLVEIKLNQAVPLNQIKGIELKHTGSGVSFDAAKASTPLGPAAGIQSPDTWDMQWLEVTAVGGGVGATVLRHGPKSFTNGDRVLSTRVQIPANSCNVDERFGRLNPGKKDVQPASGAGSRYGKEQPAPSALQLPSKSSNQQLQNNEIVRQALAHVVQIGRRARVFGDYRDHKAAKRGFSLAAGAGSRTAKPAGYPDSGVRRPESRWHAAERCESGTESAEAFAKVFRALAGSQSNDVGAGNPERGAIHKSRSDAGESAQRSDSAPCSRRAAAIVAADWGQRADANADLPSGDRNRGWRRERSVVQPRRWRRWQICDSGLWIREYAR